MLSVGVSVGTWLLSCCSIWCVAALEAPGLLFNLPNVSALLWLLLPHVVAVGGQMSLWPWLQVMPICWSQRCFFHGRLFCSTQQLLCALLLLTEGDGVCPIHYRWRNECTSSSVLCSFWPLPQELRQVRDCAEHQQTFAHTQVFVFKAVFVRGLLEKAERWSFLMGKLCGLIKIEKLIPSDHFVWQQSHGGFVYTDSCCYVSYC